MNVHKHCNTRAKISDEKRICFCFERDAVSVKTNMTSCSFEEHK